MASNSRNMITITYIYKLNYQLLGSTFNSVLSIIRMYGTTVNDYMKVKIKK
jgi:hypothetical protein